MQIKAMGGGEGSHREISLHTYIRTAKIQNSDNIKYWQGCGETGLVIYYW